MQARAEARAAASSIGVPVRTRVLVHAYMRRLRRGMDGCRVRRWSLPGTRVPLGTTIWPHSLIITIL